VSSWFDLGIVSNTEASTSETVGPDPIGDPCCADPGDWLSLPSLSMSISCRGMVVLIKAVYGPVNSKVPSVACSSKPSRIPEGGLVRPSKISSPDMHLRRRWMRVVGKMRGHPLPTSRLGPVRKNAALPGPVSGGRQCYAVVGCPLCRDTRLWRRALYPCPVAWELRGSPTSLSI
jgi:hypothetical protein